jgi:hypothetical protein
MRWVLAIVLAATAAAQGVITTVAGADYVFPDDGQPATQARLVSPGGVVFDNGELYIADFGLNMILRPDAKGAIHIQAGNRLCASSGDGGRCAPHPSTRPATSPAAPSTATSPNSSARAFRKVTAGVISTLVGFNGSGFSGDGGR